MTTTKSTLAKGLLPALLLSAALSVPAVSVAAPSPGKAHAADKADKAKDNQKHKAQHQAKQAEKAHKQAVKAQRQALKARPKVVVRTVAPNRVVVQPVRTVVVPRRVVVPQRRVVVAPAQPVYIARSRRAWEGWNRRYSRFGSGAFRLDGTFIGQQHGCALVQDRSGQVIPLLGNPGNLRDGDRLLLSGRLQNSSVCGTAFRVLSVDQINGRAYYGGSRDGFRDRYDRDRNYDDDRYDRSNGNLVSINGRLDDGGRCPVVRGDRGEYYDLVGDLRDFRDGDHARVIGFLGVRSRCGGQAIDVQEIIN